MKLTVKRPETTVDLCMDGELFARYEQQEADLKQARQEGLADRRLNGPIATKARELVETIRQMRAESVTFTLRGMPRKEWAKLLAENPPRDDNPNDKQYGANIDGLMAAAIPACIVGVTKDGEPVDFDPATDWDALADDMTDAQYDEFVLKTQSVNRGRQEVPFSQAAFKLTADSDQT